jgi:hypothetical protein
MALVVIPPVLGICWFSITEKPVPEAISSFGVGNPEKLTGTPAIVPLRSMMPVEPCATPGAATESEPASVAVIEMSPFGSINERTVAVPVASPDSVGGKGETALAEAFIVRPITGKSTTPEFVTEYGGGDVPLAGNAGPTMIGIPLMVAEMLRPVDELEMMTAALAGETPSARTKPAALAIRRLFKILMRLLRYCRSVPPAALTPWSTNARRQANYNYYN